MCKGPSEHLDSCGVEPQFGMQFRVPISHQCVNREYCVLWRSRWHKFLLFSGILSPSKSRGNETHLKPTSLRLIDILNHNLSTLLMISMRPLARSLVLSGLGISIHSQVSVGPPKGAPRLFLKPSETILPQTHYPATIHICNMIFVLYTT